MKNNIKGLIVIAVAAFIAVTLNLHAGGPTVVGVNGSIGVPFQAVTSSLGLTNVNLATNGLYSTGLASGLTETNLVALTPGSAADGDIIIQFTGTQTAAFATNAIFFLTSSMLPLSITNNGVATAGVAPGSSGSAQPRQVYSSVVLVFDGTTTTATTNLVYSKASIPSFANGLNLYLEKVQNGIGGSGLTNWSIVSLP